MTNFEKSLLYISEHYKIGNDYKEVNSFSAMRLHYLLALKEVVNQKNKCVDQEKLTQLKKLEKTFDKKIKEEYVPKVVNKKKITPGLSHSVFRVEGNKSSGTCFLVSKNDKYLYFLTNRHVLIEESFFNVVSMDGKYSLRGKIHHISSYTKPDMAVIRCTKPENADYYTPISFGNTSKLVEGMDLYIYGNRSGLGLGLIKGIISSFRGSQIMTDMATIGGTSGSALLDEYGFVIGLHVGKESNLPFAIHGNVLKDYLKSLDIKYLENNNIQY